MLKRAGTTRFLIFCGDFGSRVVLQAAYFVFISRALGVAGLGTFASLTAITTLAACFSGMGTDQIAIVNSAKPGFDIKAHFGRTLMSTAITFVPLLLCTLVAAFYSARQSVSPVYIVSVATSDILFTRMVSISASLLYIRGKIVGQFIANIVPFICKVILAAGAFFSFSTISLDTWCLLYAIGGLIGGLNAYLMLSLEIGRPKFDGRVGDLHDGLLYSMEFASLAAFRDIDKPIVNLALGAASTGAYTAAFRVVDTICVPIRAYLQSTYIKYFTAAQEGRAAAISYALKAAGQISLIGIALGFVLLPLALAIPYILGPSYASSVSIIWLMATYPLMLGLTGVGSDVLRSLGLQKARMMTLTATYLAYLPCIYVGSELYGLRGAAIARTIVQALAVALTWVVVYFAKRKNVTPPPSALQVEEATAV